MKWNKAEITFENGVLTVLSDHLNEISATNSYKKYNINSKINKNKVTHITFKNKTTLPKNASNIFSNFKNLKVLDLTNANFKNVESLSDFIYNCPSLEKVYIDDLEINNMNVLARFISKSDNIKCVNINSFKSKSLTKIIKPFSNIDHKIDLSIKETDLPNLSLLKYTLKYLTDGTLKKLNRLNAPNLEELYELGLNIGKDITLDLSNFKKLSTITLNSKLTNKLVNVIIFPTLKTEFEYIQTKNMTGYETIKNNIKSLDIAISIKDEITIDIPDNIEIYKFRYSDDYKNVKINNKKHIKQIIKKNKHYFSVTPLYENVSDKDTYIKALEDIIKEGDITDIQKYIDQDDIPEEQKKKLNLLMKLKEIPV